MILPALRNIWETGKKFASFFLLTFMLVFVVVGVLALTLVIGEVINLVGGGA